MIAPEHLSLVVVTYFPDAGFSERIRALLPRVHKAVIVDNASSAETTRQFDGLPASSVNILRNATNVGLAAGLNQGLKRSIELGCPWALLLDQDSEMSPELLPAYAAALERLTPDEVKKLAVLGNNYGTPHNERAITTGGADLRQHEAVITAGTLVNLAAYQAIGPFRDDFFIDWVDIEYCYHARKKGYTVWITMQPLIKQHIGEPQRVRTPWGEVLITNHSPRRRYFMARNLLLLTPEYFTLEPAWFLGRYWDLFKTTLKIALFEPNRRAKLTALAAGLTDGVMRTKRPPYAV
jgi:rhamnosyltransferase